MQCWLRLTCPRWKKRLVHTTKSDQSRRTLPCCSNNSAQHQLGGGNSIIEGTSTPPEVIEVDLLWGLANRVNGVLNGLILAKLERLPLLWTGQKEGIVKLISMTSLHQEQIVGCLTFAASQSVFLVLRGRTRKYFVARCFARLSTALRHQTNNV